ncbi:MAG TPA: hypothetical protein VEA15_00950 [Caulobacteraceae bacterium]|nr:hypothetical protein [Caulobacteraceae bacterium]
MLLRPCARFTTDLPLDLIVHGGQVAQLGGRPAAEAVAELLRRRGCRVQPPEHDWKLGWVLDVRCKGRRFRCRVRGKADGVHGLLFEDRTLIGRLAGGGFAFRRALRDLMGDLRQDDRFRDVTWLSRAEFERPRQSGYPVAAG